MLRAIGSRRSRPQSRRPPPARCARCWTFEVPSTGRSRPAVVCGGSRLGPRRTLGRAALLALRQGTCGSDRPDAARSCESLLGNGRRAGVGFEAGAQRLRRVVEPRLRRAERDVETNRDVRQRQVEVVVEDEHGPLLEGEPPEGPLELVAVVDGQDARRLGRSVDREKPKFGRPTRLTPGLGVALVDQDPVEPRLEAIRVAQRSQLPPGHDEGRLDGVLGEMGVTKDPVRDGHASVADRAGEGVEGLLVALLRTVHEISMHRAPLASRSAMVTDQQVRGLGSGGRFNLAGSLAWDLVLLPSPFSRPLVDASGPNSDNVTRNYNGYAPDDRRPHGAPSRRPDDRDA